MRPDVNALVEKLRKDSQNPLLYTARVEVLNMATISPNFLSKLEAKLRAKYPGPGDFTDLRRDS